MATFLCLFHFFLLFSSFFIFICFFGPVFTSNRESVTVLISYCCFACFPFLNSHIFNSLYFCDCFFSFSLFVTICHFLLFPVAHYRNDDAKTLWIYCSLFMLL
uniref:Uncharacterized protein n=1 Tax=Anopheles darlingi TaxID=43151 RepID=A0A2M4DCG8_ANODA